MKLTSMHKKIYIICGLCVALLAAAGVTYALLSTKSTASQNDFTGGQTKVNISVVEQIDGEKDHEDSSNAYVTYPSIKKGSTLDKQVKIKNISSSSYKTADTYVRVMLIPMIVKDGSTEDNREVLGDSVDVTYTFANNTKWVKSGNDQSTMYYYTEAIKANDSSDVLITKVTLNSEIKEGYHLEVQVLADGIAAYPVTNLNTAWNLNEVNGNYFSEMSAVN